ncbi:uncharacterized protein TNCV_2819621 [Trichonephila clavipes]|nr:uncharacterized protein TNCV_2819621 [Trichonephila clavipes]
MLRPRKNGTAALGNHYFSAAERNYTVTERECLAVVWALNKFRTYLGSLSIEVITNHAALTHLTNDKNLSNRIIRWGLKFAEFNIEWEHRFGTQNTVADVLSRNPIESIIGEKVNCAIIRDLILSSRDQLIKEQRTDPDLGHIYRYQENPEDSLVNATISGDTEKLFEEARRNTKAKHEKWEKYYNRRRRYVQIKVNNCVWVATHPLSSATRKVVAKFKPKFEGPYRVLDVKNNNVVIWKAGKRLTINVDQTVTPTTSGCNLRPRNGKGVESRPTIERKTQQGGQIQSRKGRGRNDSPYIEERTRSSNKNARRGADQQRQEQERKGACTRKSLCLEVLVGNANYKS